MSTPVSLVGASTPLSVLGSFDELLELDKPDKVHHGDDDIQPRLELAEKVKKRLYAIYGRPSKSWKHLGPNMESSSERMNPLRNGVTIWNVSGK
ncbi:hypothetical protein FRB97_004708, partial [Tulasnella sp. 331]